MNRRLLSAALICFLSPLAAASSSAPSTEASVSAWVHPGADAIKEGGYEGAQTCTMCHDAVLKEVTHSVHWYVSSEVRNVQGMPDGSWWGMVNRECALAGTTALANWTAATKGRFTAQAAGCGMCHIAALDAPPLPAGREATEEEAATVDCLVCHAAVYDMARRKTLVTDDAGHSHWGQDASLEAALSVTQVPTAAACLRCHEHSFSFDYKRGTPYTPTNDVHAASGIPCTSCHLTRNHKIAKGQYESDMVANDLPAVPVDCANCHGVAPHQGEAAADLNAHVARVACQTCHIPAASGIVSEDWGKPVPDDGAGPYSALSKYDGIPAMAGLWVPTISIDRTYPAVIWRVANTSGQSDAQSWMAFPTASRKTDGAKLFPVRGLTQIMLFDRNLKMWQAPGMAFLEKDPQMAQFPLLLAPNREVYNRTGDVKQALDAGMQPYRAFGLTWSGEWMPMKVPGTSYISVNHGVRRIGYSCAYCHSPHGVLDFASLGYTPDEVAKLQRPVQQTK
ncbi:MAG: hypothetical protein WAO20_05895 [Acidobacteriota bacterium]